MTRLTPTGLAIAAVLVLLLALLTARLQRRLGGQVLIAALRTTVQLLLIGLVLDVLFANAHLAWVALLSLVMLAAAGREVRARQNRRLRGPWGYSVGAISMFISSFAVTVLALVVIVRHQPWYDPQYAIPLLGMLLGNTMNGVSIAMDRFTDAAWARRGEIEARLLLGQTASEATSELRKESVGAGLIPIINAMSAAGLVSLPGMMTGQILAGSPPTEAVKYQILIMFLIAVGTGLGTLAAVAITARRIVDERQRLRLERLAPSRR
ncbi:MAG: iron export ABC transporter permease subunit FetB [Myxococcales bacterium]|nr:iron export ABC transporter permease subunit FetB [Myxococcales bacterium]